MSLKMYLKSTLHKIQMFIFFSEFSKTRCLDHLRYFFIERWGQQIEVQSGPKMTYYSVDIMKQEITEKRYDRFC